MKRTSGYTIVELAIVVSVLAILATLTVIAFNLVQAQSRDSKRAADIKSISTLLEAYYEKHGEYPTDSYLHYWSQPGRILEPSISPSSSVIGLDTTLTSLRSILGPSIADSFGDPTRSHPDYLFNSTVLTHSGFEHRYTYIGGAIGKTNSSYGAQMNFTSKSGTFRCDYTISTTPNGSSSYALGYYEEATDKWNFYLGARGSKVQIYDTNDPTCFTRITVKNA